MCESARPNRLGKILARKKNPHEMREKNIDDFTALVRRMYTEHTKCHPDHATVDKNGLYLESFCSDSSGYDFDF